MTTTLRLGTRGSALATTQSGLVAERLALAAGLPADAVELVRIRTEGDRLQGSLAALGGAGVFVAALREAVLDGRCDLAVHSLKDLPTAAAPGLLVAAVPEREDPRDALCAREGFRLADLPRGARVGTGSPRRAAQLRAVRPDLDVVDIRGNVDTRLRRVRGGGAADRPEDRGAPVGAWGPDGAPVGDLDAVVLAAAGLARLGRLDAATELLDPVVLAPAPGQGALAVEVRADDDALVALVGALDHTPTRLAVTAERSLLATLEGGCAAPIGALGHQREDGHLVLDAVVCRPDGTAQARTSASMGLPEDPQEAVAAAADLGRRVAEHLLRAGAADLAPLGPARHDDVAPGASV